MNVELDNNQFNMIINEIRTQAESIENLGDKIEEVGETINLTIYSGDQEVIAKLDQLNNSINLVAIVGALFIIYYFIMRCFR